MNEKEFADLIERYASGEATQEEAALVKMWLDQRAGKDPYGTLSDREKEKVRVAMFEDLSSRIRQRVSAGNPRRFNVPALSFYRAAAVILLMSVLSYSIFQFAPRPPEEEIALIRSVSTDAGKKIILSDSSIVWLKPNSSITYPERFSGGERKINMTGEALFEIARDAKHPFVVQCGGLTAKVLGTSFNMKSSESDVEVIVLTGKVAISSRNVDTQLIVLPNEKAFYDGKSNHLKKVMASEPEKSARIMGTQYNMRFNATPMKEIIRRIESKFDVKVLVDDVRLNNCTITADFTDQSLDRTLSMIAQTLQIDYEIVKNQITLKGAGCDSV